MSIAREGRAVEEMAKEVGKCMGDHSKHICSLAGTNRIESIIPLTTEPKYICVNCGRVADSYDNLCKPAHHDSFGIM